MKQMKEVDLFGDAKLGAELRDVAIKRVGTSHDGWCALALDAIRRVAEARPEFTTDAVWHLLHDVPEPREPRAMGAAMRRAVSAGYCLPTNKTKKSVRPDCHRRPLQVWRSLLVP